MKCPEFMFTVGLVIGYLDFLRKCDGQTNKQTYAQ